MNQNEHTQEARELMRRAQEELTNGGNNRIAAEFLWGAFAHCLITIALNEGLPHDSHGAFQRIAHHMDAAQGSNDWRSRFGSAERLHQHYYHGDLTTAVQSHIGRGRGRVSGQAGVQVPLVRGGVHPGGPVVRIIEAVFPLWLAEW